jgi:hypothetical protein
MIVFARRVFRVAVALAMTVAAVMTATAQSSFAASCSYQTCSGKDPEVMGCSDAVTKYEITASGIRSELRYSHSCGAYWNRISWDPCCSGLGQYVTLTGGTYDANGREVLKVGYTKHPTKNPDWTPMISAAWPWTIFCVYTANDDGCREVHP